MIVKTKKKLFACVFPADHIRLCILPPFHHLTHLTPCLLGNPTVIYVSGL
jgi:hypothetical protein